MRTNVAVVIPNWNGAKMLPACLESLEKQTHKPLVIVVDNGSVDDSLQVVSKFSKVELVQLSENTGFAGGVNRGIEHALRSTDIEFVALLNNDAVADSRWLAELVHSFSQHPDAGIVTSKILLADKEHIDSTGDFLTSWLLPFPRGREEVDMNQYAEGTITSASGGASLYRRTLFERIGLFDEDFFAYYEDVDVSLRAQLAGYKVYFNPRAIVYHAQGSTSARIKGFTTYHTIKNLPLLWLKNVPRAFLWRSLPRFYLAYSFFIVRALSRGHVVPTIKGMWMSLRLSPSKMRQRRSTMKTRLLDNASFAQLFIYDLPPNAHTLRRLRSLWWRLTRKGIS